MKIVHFIRDKHIFAGLEEHKTELVDIGHHTAVRWLKLVKLLKRIWDPRAEIQEFCEENGKDIPE